VSDLPGFDAGKWWVQDLAASLPARLIPAAAKSVLDACAAPGGKTMQLAAAGHQVTALDRSASRLRRLAENLQRTGLSAETIAADAFKWETDRKFDAVLLDAPCSATGTIRRHPDIMHLKTEADIERLAKLQTRFLKSAAAMVAPGGTLIYCTCSLEPEEGEQQVERFLGEDPAFARAPITPAEVGGIAAWITPIGDMRTLPHQLPLEAPYKSGMDGFYAARLLRKA
jgi:16S rRNA (cytosine967-C5)-methyltransferase